MAVIEGLAGFKRVVDAESEGGDRKDIRWFKLDGGKKITVRFLQEIDVDSPKFSVKNGRGIIGIEHAAPHDFKRKAECSLDDEGKCLGCELAREYPRQGWGQKKRFYINVLVQPEGEDPYVALFSGGTSGKSILPSLLEYAEENGSITDWVFVIKRTGSGFSDTSYSLMLKGQDKDFDPEDYEVYDLKEDAMIKVEYQNQREFYKVNEFEPKEDEAKAKASDDLAW